MVRRWFDDPETMRWLGGPDWPAETLRLARGPSRHAFLATDGDDAVALIDIELYADHRSSFAIAVAPERRRRGVASAALEALFRDPIMRIVKETFVGIEVGNVASERLVMRSGFVRVSDVDHEGFQYFARPAPSGPWRLPET